MLGRKVNVFLSALLGLFFLFPIIAGAAQIMPVNPTSPGAAKKKAGIDAWQSRNIFPLLGNINAVADNGVTYVAVGDAFTNVSTKYAAILHSADGINWTALASSPTSKNLRGVAWGGGVFIAVGDTGTLLKSVDGINWSVIVTSNLKNLANLNAITFGLLNDGTPMFVAVGEGGLILTSTNLGTDWTKQTPATTMSFFGITYGVLGNNAPGFVAVGAGGAAQISDDGVSWTRFVTAVNSTLYGVTYGNGVFIAAGASGKIVISADAVTWSLMTSGITTNLRGVAYGNGSFTAVGEKGKVMTLLSNGVWLGMTTGLTTTIKAIRHSDAGLFYAAGDAGAILSSRDADYDVWMVTAAKTVNTVQGRFIAPIFANGLFVTVGTFGRVLTSADGTTWTSSAVGPDWGVTGYNIFPVLQAIAYGNGIFVAVGNEGLVYTSPDGLAWVQQRLPAGNTNSNLNLYGVTFGNNRFVALGETGVIWSSADGITWEQQTSPTLQDLYGITYGSGKFVAVGNKVTLTSADGITWAAVTISYRLENIAFGNTTFVAVGANGIILTSATGTAWSNPQKSTVTGALYGIVYDGSTYFVAVGAGGIIISCQDAGVTWTKRASKSTAIFEGVTYGTVNGVSTFVAVGGNSTILQSDNVTP
jgi:hypothetical protein